MGWSPRPLDQNMYRKFYRDPKYGLRYILELMDIGLSGYRVWLHCFWVLGSFLVGLPAGVADT